MKLFFFALVVCFGLCCTCFASNPVVTILQPSNNASLDWPFTLQATCSSTGTITGWDVYIDGNPTPYYRNTSNSSSLDILVQASVGTHAIQAKCWAGSINGKSSAIRWSSTRTSPQVSPDPPLSFGLKM